MEEPVRLGQGLENLDVELKPLVTVWLPLFQLKNKKYACASFFRFILVASSI